MNENTTESDAASASPLGEDVVGYDPIADASYARFGTDYTTAVVAIVETVAAVTNCKPEELSPLFATIDPEALVDLVASNRETAVEVTFSYEGCRVTVSSRGTVAVELLDE